MSNIKLSILVITKDRTAILRNLLKSIIENAHDPSSLEIIFGIDYDDETTKSYIETFDFKNKTIFSYQPTKADFCESCNVYHINRHKSFLNPMALQSNGEYIWALNDDVTIHTKDFDMIIYNELNQFLENKRSKIMLAGCHESVIPDLKYNKNDYVFRSGHQPFFGRSELGDDKTHSRYFCYPIMNRHTLNTLNFFIPNEISDVGGDIILANIFKSSLAYNRITHVPIALIDTRYVSSKPNKSTSHQNLYNSKSLSRDVKKINDDMINNQEIESLKSIIKSVVVTRCPKCFNEITLPSCVNPNRDMIPKNITCINCFNVLPIDQNLFQHILRSWWLNVNMNRILNDINFPFEQTQIKEN